MPLLSVRRTIYSLFFSVLTWMAIRPGGTLLDA